MIGIPFCASPLYTVATDGSRIGLLEQRNETNPGAAFALTVLDQDGDTVFSKKYHYAPRGIERAASDSALAALRRFIPPNSKAMSAAMDAMHLPRAYQPVRRLILGTDHSVWLELTYGGEGHRWLIVSDSGEMVGTLDLPPNISIREANQDSILATDADTDGVQSVIRYHLNRHV